MDRTMISELRRRLAPEGGGGLAEGPGPLDLTSLAALANEIGGRFAVLDAPTSKRALLAGLAGGLGFPGWTGRNWDAVEEILAHPEPALSGPVLIAWLEPEALGRADGTTFRSIVLEATAARIRNGNGPLVVATGSRGTTSASIADIPPPIRHLGKVHHVALVVASIETALGFWRDMLGLELETVMDIDQDRVRIAFLGVGESKVELVQPTDDTTGVARFLAARGEGFHHVCFEVANLAETLIRLELDGLELIDTVPRRGAEGPVAFIHPRSCHGVLVELIEAPGGPAWGNLDFPAPEAARTARSSSTRQRSKEARP
ncbi:MAG: methylmalonyl-CoA epimerase [Candidatus Limnocylindrales bacterium]